MTILIDDDATGKVRIRRKTITGDVANVIPA